MEPQHQDPFEQEESKLNLEEFLEDMYEEANTGKRFGNYIIDYIATYIMSFGIGLVFGLSGYSDNLFGSILFSLFLTLLYYWGMEAAFGKTLGKFITQTTVLSEDGTKPTATQLMGRTLSRLVPFEPFSYLGGNPPRGWHDRWSRTVTVLDSSISPNL